MARRKGLFDELESTIRRSYYDSEDDALERARTLATVRDLRKGRIGAADLRVSNADDSPAPKGPKELDDVVS